VVVAVRDVFDNRAVSRRVILLIVVLLAAVPTASGDSWVTYRNPGGSIEIGTPSTWHDVRRRAELLRTTQSLAHRYPRLGRYLRSLTKGIGGPLLKVDAIDVSDAVLAQGCVTDLTMTAGDFDPTPGWPQVVLGRVEGVVGIGRVKHRFVTLSSGRALELRYHWRRTEGGFPGDGRTITLAVTQYALVRVRDTYLVSYITCAALESPMRAVVTRSIQSLRFTS
jgi:hypothetical protein